MVHNRTSILLSSFAESTDSNLWSFAVDGSSVQGHRKHSFSSTNQHPPFRSDSNGPGLIKNHPGRFRGKNSQPRQLVIHRHGGRQQLELSQRGSYDTYRSESSGFSEPANVKDLLLGNLRDGILSGLRASIQYVNGRAHQVHYRRPEGLD